MKRDIKFRAWDKEVGKIIRVGVDVDAVPYVVNEFEETVWLPDANLMQYTGLEDKNGKEIHEGDIVRQLLVRNFGRDDKPSHEVVDVAFHPTSGYNIWPNDVEVIGNIYENPELLAHDDSTIIGKSKVPDRDGGQRLTRECLLAEPGSVQLDLYRIVGDLKKNPWV